MISEIKEALKTVDLETVKPEDMPHYNELSGRTWRRYMRVNGVTFRDMVNQERKRRCLEALTANPDASFTDLTEACGYRDKESTQRAFKQWFGMGLKEWQAQ